METPVNEKAIVNTSLSTDKMAKLVAEKDSKNTSKNRKGFFALTAF